MGMRVGSPRAPRRRWARPARRSEQTGFHGSNRLSWRGGRHWPPAQAPSFGPRSFGLVLAPDDLSPVRGVTGVTVEGATTR